MLARARREFIDRERTRERERGNEAGGRGKRSEAAVVSNPIQSDHRLRARVSPDELGEHGIFLQGFRQSMFIQLASNLC